MKSLEELKGKLRSDFEFYMRDNYIKDKCEICESTENLHLHHVEYFSYEEYPQYWERLKEWDNNTYRQFRSDYSIEDLENKFQK